MRLILSALRKSPEMTHNDFDQRWFVVVLEYVQISDDEWDECSVSRTFFSSFAKAYEYATKELLDKSGRLFRGEIGRECDDLDWRTWEEYSFYSSRYERMVLQEEGGQIVVLNPGFGVKQGRNAE